MSYLFFALIFPFCATCLHAMEKIELETFKKERNKPVYYIAPEIQKLMDNVDVRLSKIGHVGVIGGFDFIEPELRFLAVQRYDAYRKIFEHVGNNQVSRYARFCCLVGDFDFYCVEEEEDDAIMYKELEEFNLLRARDYEALKKNIIEMIEDEGIHPDDIESLIQVKIMSLVKKWKDVDFEKYLSSKGAKHLR